MGRIKAMGGDVEAKRRTDLDPAPLDNLEPGTQQPLALTLASSRDRVHASTARLWPRRLLASTSFLSLMDLAASSSALRGGGCGAIGGGESIAWALGAFVVDT